MKALVSEASRSFHRFSIATVAMTLMLVWWGAAVTTEQAGMAFVDWPLSSGSINPEGWLKHLPYFLEHGHRLIASTVGFMTLALFAWSFANSRARILEVLGLVVWLIVVVGLVAKAGAERSDFSVKVAYWWAAGICGAGVIGWLVWSWRRRGWPLVTRLSALALVVVVAQAILGGLRVTEVSDLKAVLHACLAHAFFCVLLSIVMVSSLRHRTNLASANRVGGVLRAMPALLCLAVYGQLILGALMRHFHRDGLADRGIFSTGGQFFPGFEAPILTVMFFHKYWAVLVLLIAWVAAVLAVRQLPTGHKVRRGLVTVAILILAQLALGIAVIANGKSFWITNFHVLNGLAILGFSFVAGIRAVGIGRGSGAADAKHVGDRHDEDRDDSTEALPTAQA